MSKLKQKLNTVSFFIKRLYRLAQNEKTREAVVWQDLKKLHSDLDWKAGVYEKAKLIETGFELGEDRSARFHYFIDEEALHFRVKVIENYPVEIATDLFILATHFNNLLKNGRVIIDPKNQTVEYHLKCEILIPYLYPGEIFNLILRHHSISKDINRAFNRLINEGEIPAIIIADLLNEKEDSDAEGVE